MHSPAGLLNMRKLIRDRRLGDTMTAVARKQQILPIAGPHTAPALLDWYDGERRELPWRYAPGAKADA